MKRVSRVLTVVISCFLLLASCEKETMLAINVFALSFDNNGGNETVNLVANKVWSATSSQNWCKVSPFSGEGSDNGNITLSVSCDANPTYDERTCTITITCEELTKTIAVFQSEGKGFIVSQTEYNLTNEEQTISVEVQANVQYTVSIDDVCKSWIKQTSTKGLSSNTIKFTISKNADFDGREGKITIKQTDGSLSGTVVVKQSQQNGLFISTSEYNLSNEKHTLTVEVKANVEFDVKPNVDWIKYVETKGLKTSQIVLEVASNEDYDSREGKVTVKQKNGELEGVITVHQEQNYGLFLSQTEFNLSNAAQQIDVEVKYNVQFDVVIPDTCKKWISLVGTKGLSSRYHTFSISKNGTYDNREGSITFKQKNGSLSGTITIKQLQTEGLIVEKTNFTVSAEEQTIGIKVKSNANYDVIVDDSCEDWISRVQTKGLTEETITLRVAKNEGGARTGKVLLKGEGVQQEIIIQQETEVFVEFDDDEFEAFCVKLCDYNGDNKVSLGEAATIKGMHVNTDGIQSLRGIERFENLRTLNCMPKNSGKGQLTSLDVSKNTALEQLDCRDNKISVLDLSNNPALVFLVCCKNQLTILDISNNNELKDIWCYENQLKVLDIANKPKLERLSCYDNQIAILDVSKSTALQLIDCNDNKITTLDVSNHKALQFVHCKNNQIATLDVRKSTKLQQMFCGGNQLTTLDVSKNTELRTLDCATNKITSLDLSNNPALTDLECSSNQLTALNVSKNTALTWLTCFFNNLTTLDVSKSVELVDFGCGYNKLTTLDVSKNTKLNRLYCNSNQLVALDVSTNTALKQLVCISNPELKEIWLKVGQKIESFQYDRDVAIVSYK